MSLPYISQLIEKTNVSLKMHDILGFLNFLFLLHSIQWDRWDFFHFTIGALGFFFINVFYH